MILFHDLSRIVFHEIEFVYFTFDYEMFEKNVLKAARVPIVYNFAEASSNE